MPRIIQVKDSKGKNVEIVDNYGVMNTTLALNDADTGIFFARQLELRMSKAFEMLYPQFPARSLFPINNQGGPWVDQIVAEWFDKVGKAQIGTGEEKSMPRADIKGGEVKSSVRPIVTSFGYSWLEIQRAMSTGRDLEQRRANAAIFAFEQLLNQIAFYGDADAGLEGFLTNTNIPVNSASADGTGNHTTFVSKTPDTIVQNINSCMSKPWIDSGMIHTPNRLLMPPTQYEYIASTKMSTYSDQTILSYLETSNRWFKGGKAQIMPVNELAGGCPGTKTDCMIAYDFNPDMLEMYLPYPQNFFPVQLEGFQYTVPSIGFTGGVVVRYPKSMNIVGGI
jgi:hypothetical protein